MTGLIQSKIREYLREKKTTQKSKHPRTESEVSEPSELSEHFTELLTKSERKEFLYG